MLGTRTRLLALVATGLLAFGATGAALLRWLPPSQAWQELETRVPAPPMQARSDLALVRVAEGFTSPADIQFVPGSPGLAVVLEKAGLAKVVDLSHASEPTPPVVAPSGVAFDQPVQTLSELGLLGLAFHPKYPQKPLLYVNYNPALGPTRTVVSEWRVEPSKLGTEPARETRVLLEVAQPYANHDGGGLVFGPDGMLYIGMGDGGSGGDPHGHGQDLSTLLGSMLRIDVDTPPTDSNTYVVPSDNPFVHRGDARPETWAYGLRNPWRFSFDPKGRLLVGDVGQNRFEEIDVVGRGDNLGWNVREAAHCFANPICSSRGLREPIFEYGREQGTSVTGGFVYTGSKIPALSGRYVFGDFASGRIWSLVVPDGDGAASDVKLHGKWPLNPSTFGRDAAGELYVADFTSGALFRISQNNESK